VRTQRLLLGVALLAFSLGFTVVELTVLPPSYPYLEDRWCSSETEVETENGKFTLFALPYGENEVPIESVNILWKYGNGKKLYILSPMALEGCIDYPAYDHYKFTFMWMVEKPATNLILYHNVNYTIEYTIRDAKKREFTFETWIILVDKELDTAVPINGYFEILEHQVGTEPIAITNPEIKNLEIDFHATENWEAILAVMVQIDGETFQLEHVRTAAEEALYEMEPYPLDPKGRTYKIKGWVAPKYDPEKEIVFMDLELTYNPALPPRPHWKTLTILTSAVAGIILILNGLELI